MHIFYTKISRKIVAAWLLSFLLFNAFGFGFNKITAAAENIKETSNKQSVTPNISDHLPNIGNGGGGHVSPVTPSFSYLGLEVVTNPGATRDTDWSKVHGSLVSGFVLKTDPKIAKYYLRLTKDTDTNVELARGVYAFNLVSYPDAFAAYVDRDAALTPYRRMIDALNPAFYLYADGQGSLILLDGLNREKNWHINGDFPVGEYKYRGRVTGVNGSQSDNIDLRFNIEREINVPINQAPVAKDDSYATRQNTQLIIAPRSILDNDNDPDGAINPNNHEILSAKVETWPQHGKLIMCLGGGCFSYTPDNNFVGKDIFTYRAFDGQALSNLATVTISVVNNNNQAPVANDDSYSVTTGNTLNVLVSSGVLANDTDTDGPQNMTAVLVANVSHGTLTLASDGSFNYQSASGFTGADTFTYHAFDGLNYSNTVTTTISVNSPSGGGGGGGGGSSSRQPNSASVLINNNASATNSLVVTLTLVANNMVSQYAPLEMKIGNFSDLSSVSWRPFSTTTSWTLLNGIGSKTVYVQFKNSRGTSVVVSDSINYVTGQVLGDRDCSNSAGMLIAKRNTKDAAVYFIGSDCKKYVFPDPKTYYTWYDNFNSVIKVDIAELDFYKDGGVVPYRSGVKLVKHPDTNNVYAVEPNGTLRLVPSPEIARALYGDKWKSLVQDVITGYFFNSYTIGDPLTANSLPTGTLVKEKNGDTIYYVENGKKKPFSSNYNFDRHYFKYKNVLVKDDLSAYPTIAGISSLKSELSPYRLAY